MTPEEAKFQRKLNSAESVRKPDISNYGCCWAVVKKPSTGSAHNRVFGRFGNCERRPRKGHLTCGAHKDREQEAQGLKAKKETP